MFDKLENSWKLAKECWRVLMLDKEMLMFPVLNIITSIIAGASIIAALWFTDSLYDPTASQLELQTSLFSSSALPAILTMVLVTYVLYVITIFFNAGLITCAFIRLCGDDPVLADGFNIAWKRLPQILAWSVIATTVGLLLRLLKGKNGNSGGIISGLLGFGWRVATFFTIPVIVAEEKGPIDAAKRSASLIKKNWGEAISLEVGFTALAAILMAIPMALFGFATQIFIFAPILAGSMVALSIIIALVVSITISTLDAIAKAALYMFASSGQMPEGFSQDVLENTFKQKNGGTLASA